VGGDDGGGALVTSNLRRAKALWNILSSAGRTVGVIGWLITFPAEPVSGYMISDKTVFLIPSQRFVGAQGRVFEDMRNGIYPLELWDEVAGLRVAEAALPEKETKQLLGGRVPAEEEASRRLISIRRFTAADLTVVNLVTHMATSRPTEFTAVYMHGIDYMSHFFWRYRDPDSWGRSRLSSAAITAFAPVLDRYYEKTDAMLGTILRTRDDNTIVIVCSDHGFAGHRGHPGFEGGVAASADMHRAEGTIIMEGPGILRGKRIEGATIYDIAPTVLVLAGLPVGRDMDGKPLTEVIAPSYLKARPVSHIETYETGARSGDHEPVTSPVDEEAKEMLRSLGYIK
jgi:predicted AlkP superfamily phosphohydrolase/phosphomutase